MQHDIAINIPAVSPAKHAALTPDRDLHTKDSTSSSPSMSTISNSNNNNNNNNSDPSMSQPPPDVSVSIANQHHQQQLLRQSHIQAATWLAVYFFFNLGLTIYNKAVMQFYKFPFPWTLTGIHTLCGAIGCQILASFGVFKPAKLGMRENLIMLAFSTLYTINIAISNVSLHMVSVPFHQTVRAMVPLFTMIMEYFMFRKSFSYAVSITMIPIVLGVSLATIGDYSFTGMGLLLTILGAVLAALKGIVTNFVQVGKLKLHPLDLLLRMSPLALIQTLFYSFLTGELREVAIFVNEDLSTVILFVLLINGAIAFGLNVSSFTANKMTSALTMGVAGNVKQVLSIVISVVIFNITVTFTNGIGILLTLIGGAMYTHAELREKQRRANLAILKPAVYSKVSTEDDSEVKSASSTGSIGVTPVGGSAPRTWSPVPNVASKRDEDLV
eukprot:jgi/Hompol1/232/HPOL_001866-RA